jgi:hypothetical protein
MTALARLRRRIQQLGPYQSLALLIVPVGLVEPLKIVALFVGGKGHWLSGTAMIIGAYVLSLFFVERLFRVIKPKLMALSWFAKLWTPLMTFRSKVNRWFRVSIEGANRVDSSSFRRLPTHHSHRRPSLSLPPTSQSLFQCLLGQETRQQV